MNPGEVSVEIRVPLADEVGVDVEVGVGDQAEVLVFSAVEVECDAVAADEARVLANSTRGVATYLQENIYEFLASIYTKYLLIQLLSETHFSCTQNLHGEISSFVQPALVHLTEFQTSITTTDFHRAKKRKLSLVQYKDVCT